MTETTVNRPAWVDLASGDAATARDFYGALFGWDIEVNPDPQYGGYALAKIHGKDVAGLGPKMDPTAPTAWNLYIGADAIEAVALKVEKAGGTVVMAPFNVGDQGRMVVFRDPGGAFISAWQGARMGGFETEAVTSFAWAELNARGVNQCIEFYREVFGWKARSSPMGEGRASYTEFQLDGTSIAGAWEMNEMVPPEVPGYWQVYFSVDDVDASFARAQELGGRELVAPRDFAGGRFAIVTDPEGATFGLLKMRG